MHKLQGMLALLIWAMATVVNAGQMDDGQEAAAVEQLKGYQSELEATYQNADNAADETLQVLLERMDSLNADLDGMVAQVQR